MDTRTPTPMLHVLVAIIIGLFAAIYLGQAAAQGSYSKVGIILGLLPAMFLVLGLQDRVWLTVPFFSSFGGSVPFIPLPFAVRELAMLLTFCVFVMLAVFKKLEKRGRFDFLDLLVLLNLLYLFSVYVRNPVGMNILGSERVGGRPYYAVIVFTMLYWSFSHLSISPKMAFRLPLIILAGSVASFLFWLVSYKVPAATPIMAKIYSGVDFSQLLSSVREGGPIETGIERLSSLSNLGSFAILCLIAYYPPLTLLSPMYFWRFCGFGLSAVAMLMGGFRTKLFSSGLYYFLACYFRGGMGAVIRAAFPVAAGTLLLVGFQFLGVGALPLAVQRSLSALPLPIEWDHEVMSDAEGSSQWRYDMWHDVLSNEQWIHNKWLGDGFGFTRYELKIMYNDLLGGQGFMEGGSEAQKITGAYHSGPLSAIRFVGVVGLILYLLLSIAAAMKSWRYIKLTEGTLFHPFAMLNIPVIFAPIIYVFVFGGFDTGLSETIGGMAYLKLLSRSFDDYKAGLKAEAKAAGERVASPPEPALAPALLRTRTAFK